MSDPADIADQKIGAYEVMGRGSESVSPSQVIRPKYKHAGWASWAHLPAGEGQPLCGATLLTGGQDDFRTEPREGDTKICHICAQREVGYFVKTLKSGQIRRYGPSHYIYEVTDLLEPKRKRDEVLSDCKRLVKSACDRDEMPHPFAAVVKGFESIGDGKWRYFVFMESTH